MSRLNRHSGNRGRRTRKIAAACDLSPDLQLWSTIEGQLRNKSAPADALEVRLAELVPKVHAEKVAALAIEAREQMKLSHTSLHLVREMARHKSHRGLVAETLVRVIQTPDDLVAFLAIYWKKGRAPLSSQIKKGLAAAFPKFDEHQLAKCEPHERIKLRDVLFLSHAKPRDEAQASVWKRLIWGRLIVSRTSKVGFPADADSDRAD
jgi:60 kDa SS-A/Ro ribonucleoprotein